MPPCRLALAVALAVGHPNENHVVERELALRGAVVDRERQDAPVDEADAPALALLAARLLHDHCRCPVHVVERQPRVRERLLPGRALVGLLAGFDPLHGFREVCLGAPELNAAGVALVARQALLQRRLDHPLQLGVDGRAHRIGVGGDRLDPGRRLGLAGDLVDEVEADVAARLVGGERRQCGQTPAVLLGHGDPVLLQAAEHIGEPLLRPPGMAVRTVEVRPLGQPGQQRALFEREVLHRLAEIALRRHLDSPGAAAEEDEVEIKLEDLVLAERPLQPGGDDHLADLALVGQVLAHQQVLHHLLGDGGAALRPARAGEVADEGTDQAALVDAFVGVEALVLGRDERLLHVLGDVGERDPEPALVLLEHVGEAGALAVEHHAGAGELESPELVMVREVGGRLVVEIDHLAEIDRGLGDLLVLAELPVGDVQVGEIDAAKRLDLAGKRLRVVQCGGDQLVEVDVLDVEGLAHMGAAGLQQPGDLLLVAGAVELGFHRVRRGRHLAERQRGAEDFDQERFHPGTCVVVAASENLHPTRRTRLLLGHARRTCRRG